MVNGYINYLFLKWLLLLGWKMADNEKSEDAKLTFKEALHAQSEVVHSKCNSCTRGNVSTELQVEPKV